MGAPAVLVADVAERLGTGVGAVEQRRFPDGEAYVRLGENVRGRDILIFCSLDRAEEKILPLLFAADAAREQGARRVGLVAPYLAYMRQDRVFRDGEAVSSRTFARVLSQSFDWLLTVDPHLHRYKSLDEIYTIPTVVVTASDAIATWIAAHVADPLIVGPDIESEQWVSSIASRIAAPFATFRKLRESDFGVRLDAVEIEFGNRNPVLVDDLISSAHTMAEAVKLVREKAARAPVCIGVHALFAGGAHEVLSAAGPALIATTDTVAHPTNAISVANILADAIEDWLVKH
jgi:ribose-phosphate pyrophosphokinase